MFCIIVTNYFFEDKLNCHSSWLYLYFDDIRTINLNRATQARSLSEAIANRTLHNQWDRSNPKESKNLKECGVL